MKPKKLKRVDRATLIKLLNYAAAGWREEYIAAHGGSKGTPPDIRYVAARGAVRLERALDRAERRRGRPR